MVAFAPAVPVRLTALGDIAHVAFAGPPLHAKVSVPEDPLTGVTVSVYVAFFPAALWDAGVTDKLKSATSTATGADVLGLKPELPL